MEKLSAVRQMLAGGELDEAGLTEMASLADLRDSTVQDPLRTVAHDIGLDEREQVWVASAREVFEGLDSLVTIHDVAGRDTLLVDVPSLLLDENLLVALPGDVQSSLRSQLLPLLRHKAAAVRLDLAGDAHHLIGDRHLHIQILHTLRKFADVRILDVAAILAQVRGDPPCARLLREKRPLQRTRRRGKTRLAHGRNVIDIHSEFQHDSFSLISGGAAAARRNSSASAVTP